MIRPRPVSILGAAVAAVALGLSAPVLAQEAPSPPASDASASPPADAPAAGPLSAIPYPQTWEDLPQGLRERLEARFGAVDSVASVLMVEAPAAPDAAPRQVQVGDMLTLQTVRPGKAAVLKGAPERDKYGAEGELLWPVRLNGKALAYCRRAPPPSMAKQLGVAMMGVTPSSTSNVYCWVDRDNDGRFEALFENNAGAAATLAGSAFQVTGLGHDEGLKTPVAYEVSDRTVAVTEQVGLRYGGPTRGLVADDGRVTKGLVRLELMIGAGPDALAVGRTFEVSLDQAGRGRLDLPGGFAVEILRADVDGVASLRLERGLPQGETILAGQNPRDVLLQMIQDMLRERGGAPSTGT